MSPGSKFTFVTILSAIIVFADCAAPRLRCRTLEEHEKDRADLIKREELLTVGGKLQLTQKEQLVNTILMKLKWNEVDEGFADVASFNPAHHFFHRKQLINDSPVFKFIKSMPKAAALHAHDTALVSTDFIVKNITYMDHLYACLAADGIASLVFSNSLPSAMNRKRCAWKLVSDLRKESDDVEQFDAELSEQLTMVLDNPEEMYPNVDAAWDKFQGIFGIITPMLTYKPVWEMYFYEAMRQFREDGAFYMEIRSTLPDLYDLEGNVYNAIECAKTYKVVNDRFKKDHPDSFGARIIYAPLKPTSNEDIRRFVEIAVELKAQLGDFLAGFDLVGQEDKERPLEQYVVELLKLPETIDVFYHAGETNWYGTSSDNNLIDAILLGVKRLGHGFAMFKHPVVADMIKDRRVAVEVNPISNQVLRLVDDFRNHPATMMLANDFPMIVSSDDPGLWGGLPLSYDLYIAFVGMASRDADLRLLKQLLLNSIKYNSMPIQEKYFAYSRFEEMWQAYMNEVITDNKPF